MQRKPYCREERFLANEKPLLQPLPNEVYEIKYYRELKVAKNNHIQLTIDNHYYSVPYQWIGERVKVIYTRINGSHLCPGKDGGHPSTELHPGGIYHCKGTLMFSSSALSGSKSIVLYAKG